MPTALKVFLLTLAIFDDLAAIIIIALFYSGDLSPGALIIGAAALALAGFMNYRRVTKVSAYVLVGIVLWVAVLKSGVHATLAGVLIALCIPMRAEDGHSPLRELEDDLHTPVAFAILPIFAFANAGLTFAGLSPDDLFNPVSIGITAGLVLGKPIGILLFVGLGIAIGIASKPPELTWLQLLGVACTCGIGFTMSLFIAGLAFEHTGASVIIGDRLSILAGSVVSALIAYLLLRFSLPDEAGEGD